MENQKKIILKDKQIIKFSLYGFLKNLQFFEAYLIIYLTSNSISLFEIGILIAIREIIVNIFEVPSGLMADYFGKKKELCLCF
ncbi:MAG: MFS transporter, partial [Bacilli bacterium]